MSHSASDSHPDENSKDLIILIDEETLTQDCLAEAMRSAFPQAIILGTPTIDKLPRPNGTSVALILLKTKPYPLPRDGLANDIRSIARYFPKVPIVVITACDDAPHVGIAMAAGAQGVIPVTASLKIAVAALQLVLAGGTYYPQSVIDSARLNAGSRDSDHGVTEMPSHIRESDPSHNAADHGLSADGGTEHHDPDEHGGLLVTFTARETDVLAALQMGRSNKWIAHHLNLSENTVKVHIRHIMRKLRATNRTEAVVLSQHRPPDSSGR
ncbi:response regulator transcription factor [Microvirga lenta]|uniref:response regulator transcription factor n=1 Tax=Microvirga lenta TaxID=2881337 RepID=UPI001CFFBF33|nr:response regulator transcription factor [Microvirga lenta]MCB5176728.1 response regulator transcription factor [Microvirga lenta]